MYRIDAVPHEALYEDLSPRQQFSVDAHALDLFVEARTAAATTPTERNPQCPPSTTAPQPPASRRSPA